MANLDPIFVEQGAPSRRTISGIPQDFTGRTIVLRVYGADLVTALLSITCEPTGNTGEALATFDGESFLALETGGYETVLEIVEGGAVLADGRWHGALYVEGPGYPDVVLDDI